MSAKVWFESLKRKVHSKNIGIGGRIILKWILRKSYGMITGFTWLRIVSGGELRVPYTTRIS
jgi:hypothetical protein